MPAALRARRPGRGASARSTELVDAFGRDRVLVELWDHGDPLDRHRNDALAQRRDARAGVEVVATNNVHYATPARRPLATALAAVRARRSLDEIDGWLPAAPFAHLRSAGRAAPAVRALAGRGRAHGRDRARVRVRPAARGARACPTTPVPDGSHRDDVAARAHRGAARRVRYPSTHPQHAQAMRQIDYELDVIEQLGFPGYFLLLHDIVEFCRRPRHLLPGAGERGEQRGLLRARRHQGRRGRRSACCSSGSSRPSATVRPTSTSTSSTSAARR